jgi:hypothetical protein
VPGSAAACGGLQRNHIREVKGIAEVFFFSCGGSEGEPMSFFSLLGA